MIKNIEKVSFQENIQMIATGVSYAMFEANLDKKMYEEYKVGKLKDISLTKQRDVNILSLLEGLGFPMDELGTYLYKDVIGEVYEQVKDISKREDMQKCRELMKELTDAYSCFYRFIARDDKEMGLSSFHFYIEQAISKIDEKLIDKELAVKVFGTNPEDTNYGLLSFQLASYVAHHYSMEPEFNRQKVMGLSNLPKDIRLKP